MMEAHRQTPDFALAPGGPVDRLQARIGIVRPDAPRLIRRAVALGLVTWIPLLVANLLHPNLEADVSFYQDIGAHARFLLVVPLLIVAEGSIGIRTRLVAKQFLLSGLVADEDAGRFESAMVRAVRLRDSVLAEILLIGMTGLLVWFGVRSVMHEPLVFWFEHGVSGTPHLSFAGWWYAAVATPVFVFLLLRWLWRYIIWCWFLRRVSRLDLHLTGAHPDRMGGLGFVPFHQAMFAMITFAMACAVSAAAANRILYGGVALVEYKTPIIAIMLVAVVIGVAPLLAFTRSLLPVKRRSWMTYTRFASDYVWSFEQKWLRGKSDEDPLGSGDIQSLADLGNSFDRMVGMRALAIDRRLVVAFLLAAALPMVPLLLTVMPLREIVKFLLKAMI